MRWLTTLLFQDNFLKNGPAQLGKVGLQPLGGAKNNPSITFGLTQMRQSLPVARNGMARIHLDTWLDGNAFSGSEAITKQAFALPGKGGGITFQAKLKFEGTQGGMIAGFFTYQKFPPGVDRDIHDEINVEILTTNLKKVSTNVFAHETLQEDSASPIAPCHNGGLRGLAYHYPDGVVSGPASDGSLMASVIRTEENHVPTQPQQLHMNLWGVPKDTGALLPAIPTARPSATQISRPRRAQVTIGPTSST